MRQNDYCNESVRVGHCTQLTRPGPEFQTHSRLVAETINSIITLLLLWALAYFEL